MKFLKTLAALACAAVIFTSCDDKQTSFDINSVPGKSVLKGTVVYNAGTSYVSGKFVHNYKPAANLDLMVVVQNSAYGDNLNGETVFKTTTDENGNYELTIPAPLGKSTQIRVQSAEFEGERSYVTVENNSVKTATETVVYGVYSSANVYMQTEGICIANFECSYNTPNAIAAGYTQYGQLTGRIGRNAEFYVAPQRRYNDYGNLTSIVDATVYKTYVPAPNADFLIKVTDNNFAYTYNVTTDANGNFSLSVPVAGFPASFSYSISLMPQQDAKYTHYVPVEKTYVNYYDYERTYTDYDAVTLNGWYAEYEYASQISGNVTLPVVAAVKNIEVKGLIFNCNNAADYNYFAASFESNLPWKADLEEELKKQEEEANK